MLSCWWAFNRPSQDQRASRDSGDRDFRALRTFFSAAPFCVTIRAMRTIRLSSLVLASIVAGTLVPGCGTDDNGGDGGAPDMMPPLPPDMTPPPAICRTPMAPGAAWFTEVTSDVGLAYMPNGPIATGVHAADLDGDGYADLIANGPGATRDTPMMRNRFLLMNRPDPADPTGVRRIFVDTTKDSGILDTRDGMGGYAFGIANFADVDNDGDVDVVVGPASDVGDPGACMLNDGHGHFTLAPVSDMESQVAGFGSATAALTDFDADGNIDYLAGTFQYPPPNYNPPLLMKGAGDGRFSDVAEKMGINVVFGSYKDGTNLPAMYGLTACDLDGDGDQDIIYSAYGREPNKVYIQDAGKFTEHGVELGIAYDDRMDFSDDQSYRCYCFNRPGKCMPQPPDPEQGICEGFGIPGAKDGRGWFPGDSDQPYRLGGNNFGTACGDIDNDGDIDLFNATIRHGDVGSCSDPSELIVNVTAPGMPLKKFERPGGVKTGIDRSAYEGGIFWNEGDMTPVMVDLDLDGLKDIYLTSSDYPGDHGWIWHQKPDHTFEDISGKARAAQKEAHGVAFFDMDHDGDLDVAVGTSTFRGGAPTSALRIWRNDVGQSANFTAVSLRGLGAGHTNGSGIGARVKVVAGGVTQIQEMNGGYASSVTQNDLVLTFGLGATCTIDSIEVRWLDGKNTTQTFKDVRANYRIRITEGDPNVAYLP